MGKDKLRELEKTCESVRQFLQENEFTPYDSVVVSLDGVKVIHTDASIPNNNKATESQSAAL